MLLFFSSLALSSQARKLSGTVKSGKHKLENVVVTDGRQFTQTDKKGSFNLEVADTTEFVYIFNPSGYSAPFTSGSPKFYEKLTDSTGNIVFDLEKLPFSNDHYALVAIADPQTRTKKHFNRFREQALTDVQESVSAFKREKTNTIGLALGDLVWDSLDLFADYKEAMASLGIPFYQVIGNHDYDLDIPDDYASSAKYRESFGPTDYGFQMGNDYYLVLDDIIYNGNKQYDTDLTEAQMEWVKNYLQFVPKGSRLIIAVHAPIYLREPNKLIGRGQELIDLCADYQLQFMSGHTHLNSNFEIAPGILEHNMGAICGSWWTADLCRDGAPIGYQIFEASAKDYKWHYKSIGKPADYQLEVYNRGIVAAHPNAVVAKIWNWDAQWKVEWYEDNLLKGEMKAVEAKDPDYLRYLYDRDPEKLKEVPGYKQPYQSYFYFTAQPSHEASSVKVVATDRFGNKYIQTLDLRRLEVEAHRGGAGLMPENTIEAMLNAVKMGVNTLELDVHISKDQQVIVAHDAHFNPAYTTKADSTELSKEEAAQLAFYHLNYAEISQYNTGRKVYERFPDQAKLNTCIPLLSALIDSVESYCAREKCSPVHYNIEIKSNPELEAKALIPAYEQFADLTMQVLQDKNLGDRLLVQSFDPRSLNHVHKQFPTVNTAFLVSNKSDLETNLAQLNYVPTVYSPNFKMVDQQLVDACQKRKLKLVVWTVDQINDIQKMIELNVDGIISNYPNEVLKQTRGYL